jgi:hypothetical protein
MAKRSKPVRGVPQVPTGVYLMVTLATGLDVRRVNDLYTWMLLMPEVVCVQDLAVTSFESLQAEVLMRTETP